MHDPRLRDTIKQAGESAETSRPPIGEVVRRGRWLNRRRQIGLIATCALIGSGTLLTYQNLRQAPGPHSAASQDRSQLAETVDSPATVKAAVVATRALGRAGLLNITRRPSDYQGIIEETQNRWTAVFDRYDCTREETERRCRRMSGGPILVRVEKRGNEMVVTGAEGNVPPHAAERIVGYRESAAAAPSEMDFPHPVLREYRDTIALAGTPLWTGPIPSRGTAIRCIGVGFNAKGEEIFQGGSLSMDSPSREEMRSGSFVAFDVSPPNDVASFEIRCRTVQVDGWQPKGEPVLRKSGDDLVDVEQPLVWEGEPFMVITTACEAIVYDESGAELGRSTGSLIGPEATRGSHFEATIVIQVSIPESSRPSGAAVTCLPGEGEE